jgi:cation diffusion facilitator CzcD-associated flavoprotein CzcO
VRKTNHFAKMPPKSYPIPLDTKKIAIVAGATVVLLVLVPFPLHLLVGAVFLAQLLVRQWFTPMGQTGLSSKDRPEAVADLAQKPPKVAIIGSGYAGLSAASVFQAARIPYVVLEKSSQAGESWVSRYSRLHLHTPKAVSAISNFPLPSLYPDFLSRLDVARYLNSVAQILNVSFNSEVSRVDFDPSKKIWNVTYSTNGKTTILQVPIVILATGKESYAKKLPQIPGMDQFKGEVFHSVGYSTGAKYKGKRVMVVGVGNTGTEIAIDLVEKEAAEVISLVRSPIHILPRWLTGVLQKVYSFAWPVFRVIDSSVTDLMTKVVYPLCYGDVQNYNLKLREKPGPVTLMLKEHKTPIVDIGWIDLIRKRKIEVVPSEIASFTADGVKFKNGKERQLDVVVFATGFEFDGTHNKYLDEGACKAIGEQGRCIESGFEISGYRGLYMVGWSDFFGRIFEMQLEAKAVLNDIKKKGYA